MQFYWRIMEELKYLGEVLIFRDPTLLRQYDWWLRKNAGGVARCREMGDADPGPNLPKRPKALVSLN